MAFQLLDYVLCKYIGEYINRKLNMYWDNAIHPEDMNRIIDARIRHYAMNNRLHTVYSQLYDELKPYFKKYWCTTSNVRIQLPPFFKTKKQVTCRNIYNSLGNYAIMEIVDDMINYYFPGLYDKHVTEFKMYFNREYERCFSH